MLIVSEYFGSSYKFEPAENQIPLNPPLQKGEVKTLNLYLVVPSFSKGGLGRILFFHYFVVITHTPCQSSGGWLISSRHFVR